MKAFLVAVVVAIALGVGAGLLLTAERETAYEAYATSSARVGDPGHNLVGPNWSGLGRAES